MRLSPKYQQTLKNILMNFLMAKSIFLVVKDQENLFAKKIKFLSRIKRELGEQKIDVIFNQDPNRLIEQEAKKWGIRL